MHSRALHPPALFWPLVGEPLGWALLGLPLGQHLAQATGAPAVEVVDACPQEGLSKLVVKSPDFGRQKPKTVLAGLWPAAWCFLQAGAPLPCAGSPAEPLGGSQTSAFGALAV